MRLLAISVTFLEAVRGSDVCAICVVEAERPAPEYGAPRAVAGRRLLSSRLKPPALHACWKCWVLELLESMADAGSREVVPCSPRLSVEAWYDNVDMFSCGRAVLGSLLSPFWFVGASLSHRLGVSLPFDLSEVERRRRLDFSSVNEDREESLRWLRLGGETWVSDCSSERMAVVGLLPVSEKASLIVSSEC